MSIEKEGEQTLEQKAKVFVGRRGIPGDCINNVVGIFGALDESDLFPTIEPARTYEGYFRNDKFSHMPEFAEAVIAATDPELMKQYNEIIERINEKIGAGVRSQGQADSIKSLRAELNKVVYG